MKALFATLWFAVLCGCGSHPATVNGTYMGNPFAVGDVVSGSAISTAGVTVTKVIIDGTTSACDRAGKNQLSKNIRSLVMFISTSGPLSPGIFSLDSDTEVIPPPYVDAQVNSYDDNCTRKAVVANDGSVTVTHVDANGVSGTFDFTFDAGHLTGNFSSVECAAVESVNSNPETCS